MIPNDAGSRPGDGLPPDVVAAFQAALRAYSLPPHDFEPLRASVHALAAEARNRSLPAEQVLVTLKDVWYTLPSVCSMRDATEQNRLLQQVVTVCILAYYQE